MQTPVNYDAVAPTYDRRYDNYAYPGTLRALEEIAARRAGLRVLDVGCGTGRWLTTLRDSATHLAGLDASEGMLAHARTRLPAADLRRGSADSLPWRDDTFDLVFCNNALHHFPDKSGFVSEAARVLAPGGELLVIGLEPQAVPRWCIYEYFEGTRERDEQRFPQGSQIRTWMEDCGFTHCTTREVERISLREEAAAALERGRMARHMTSQLSLLSDAEYTRGIDRIRIAIADAATRGEVLHLHAELCLFGTHGVLGAPCYGRRID